MRDSPSAGADVSSLSRRVGLSVQHPHHPGEKRGGRGDDVYLKFRLRPGRGERQLHGEDKPSVPYEVRSK